MVVGTEDEELHSIMDLMTQHWGHLLQQHPQAPVPPPMPPAPALADLPPPLPGQGEEVAATEGPGAPGNPENDVGYGGHGSIPNHDGGALSGVDGPPHGDRPSSEAPVSTGETTPVDLNMDAMMAQRDAILKLGFKPPYNLITILFGDLRLGMPTFI